MENDVKKIKRKCRVAFLSTDHLAVIIQNYKPDEQFNILLPKFRDLPDGFEILHTFEDFKRRALAFVVYHESFEEIPAWAEYPEIQISFELVPVIKIG